MGPPYARVDAPSASIWSGLGGGGGSALDVGMLPIRGSGGVGATDAARGGATGLVDLWNGGASSMFYCGGSGSSTDNSLSPSAAISQLLESLRSVQTPLLQPPASTSLVDTTQQLLTSVAGGVVGGTRPTYQGQLSPVVGGVELLQSSLGMDNATDLTRLLDAQTLLKQLNVNGFGLAHHDILSPVAFRSPFCDVTGCNDVMADIENQLRELSLGVANDGDSSTSSSNRCSGGSRSAKKPPSTYLCHLCFKTGHFIKDCPQVKRWIK